MLTAEIASNKTKFDALMVDYKEKYDKLTTLTNVLDDKEKDIEDLKGVISQKETVIADKEKVIDGLIITTQIDLKKKDDIIKELTKANE